MPRRRFEELPEERREQILQAAGKEFAEHGFDGASLNHILAAAGVSKGAAYYYFDDKADLFATVARHYVDHILAHVDLDMSAVDAARYWPKIRETYAQLVAHTQEQPWILGIAKAAGTLSSEARGQAILAPLWEWARGLLTTLVERGQALGLVRRDVPTELLIELVLAVDSAFDRFVLADVESSGPREALALTNRVLDMMARMLAPPGGGP